MNSVQKLHSWMFLVYQKNDMDIGYLQDDQIPDIALQSTWDSMVLAASITQQKKDLELPQSIATPDPRLKQVLYEENW